MIPRHYTVWSKNITKGKYSSLSDAIEAGFRWLREKHVVWLGADITRSGLVEVEWKAWCIYGDRKGHILCSKAPNGRIFSMFIVNPISFSTLIRKRAIFLTFPSQNFAFRNGETCDIAHQLSSCKDQKQRKYENDIICGFFSQKIDFSSPLPASWEMVLLTLVWCSLLLNVENQRDYFGSRQPNKTWNCLP